VPVVLTLALAACTSSQTVVLTTTTTTTVATTKPLPAVDVSATPGGWMPVAFGDAQISVPSTWRVLYNSSECPTGSPQGEVLVNPQLAICRNEGAGSQGPKTMVWLNLLTKLGSGYKHRTVISGFSVYDDLGTYFVPSLRLQFGASGPLAQRVLHTLTRSPRVIALASGPGPAVQYGWHTLSFHGLSFTAPAWWPVTRTLLNYGVEMPCASSPGVAFVDGGVGGGEVVLSTDIGLAAFPCPFESGNQEPVYPGDGVEVDAGSNTLSELATEGLHLAFSKHCLDLHGLTACPASSPAYSILVLRVTAPGHRQPVFVSIGLTGNGMTARTILYSLRAVSSSETLGSVTGSFVAVGGPAPGSPRPLPGQVTAQNSAGHKFTVTVGKGGKFVLWLPAGLYRLTGRSPMFSVNGVEGTCAADQPVRVKAGKKALGGVEVICQLS
jgi:hypothetical protein